VNTQVLAAPIEKAAFELKARVKCNTSNKTGTGSYGFKNWTARNLVSWSINTTASAMPRNRYLLLGL